MNALTFSELFRLNEELGELLREKEAISLKILSNVTMNQLKPILEYALRSESLNAVAEMTSYDNILQESMHIQGKAIPVVFWELCNLKSSFAFEIEYYTPEEISRYAEKTTKELELLFDNLRQSPLVIFNRFSHILFTNHTITGNNFERFVKQLNDFLIQHAPPNFLLIDLDRIFSAISLDASVDLRNYYSSKVLYTVNFLKSYTSQIVPVILSTYAKSRKVIILDCDNTLWKGIVGEDGWEHLAISDKDKDGIYFKEVQCILKSLIKKGIVLCLCSKNNAEDVEEVFQHRHDMVLKSDDFVIKKINWNDKASNIREIAGELNLGTDSFIFVDDSEFEINLVKEQLPEVKTIQVPVKLFHYPRMILDHLPLCFSLSFTNEDLARVQMYQQELRRTTEKSRFQDMDDYLASLGIKVVISEKNPEEMERLTQLTQKTNQFNLTTKRYLPGEMQQFYQSSHTDVLSLSVSDKFGNFGITGLCIIKYSKNIAVIDTLLLSCRILGRNIESVFLMEIVKRVYMKRYDLIQATYKKTLKNGIVESFYDKSGFALLGSDNDERRYETTCRKFLGNARPVKYIKVIS